MENKTAMQQMIEVMKYMGCQVINADEFLEKEKEQIIDAWEDGDNGIESINAETYFHQTYNQQRIIEGL